MMNDDDESNNEAEEEYSVDKDLPEYQRLTTTAEFSQTFLNVPWFQRLGEPLEIEDEDAAEAYLSAVGFPTAGLGMVESWPDAAEIAENPEWNSDWWEAEEQLRAGLVADALQVLDERDVMNVLNHVSGQAAGIASDAATEAAIEAGFEDGNFVIAAAGIATASCYLAGLARIAGADDDHPFLLKYHLFELGRCPIGVIGTTFSIF
jgi:hypothetical protein